MHVVTLVPRELVSLENLNLIHVLIVLREERDKLPTKRDIPDVSLVVELVGLQYHWVIDISPVEFVEILVIRYEKHCGAS